jgi:hypothetical protein
MISIISIDIGLKTFSLYKEYFDSNKSKSISIPKSQYTRTGEATDDFEEYILKVSMCGQCQYIEKKDFGERKDIFTGKVFLNIYNYLDDLHFNKHIFDDVDVIIMEKQLGRNPMATTIMNHVHSWFLIQFRNFKKIILYPSKNKTRVLGAPLSSTDENGKKVKMDKSFRKKWSTEKASQILIRRDDEETYNYIFIENKSKKDDLSDVITQCLSYHINKLLKTKGL